MALLLSMLRDVGCEQSTFNFIRSHRSQIISELNNNIYRYSISIENSATLSYILYFHEIDEELKKIHQHPDLHIQSL